MNSGIRTSLVSQKMTKVLIPHTHNSFHTRAPVPEESWGHLLEWTESHSPFTFNQMISEWDPHHNTSETQRKLLCESFLSEFTDKGWIFRVPCRKEADESETKFYSYKSRFGCQKRVSNCSQHAVRALNQVIGWSEMTQLWELDLTSQGIKDHPLNFESLGRFQKHLYQDLSAVITELCMTKFNPTVIENLEKRIASSLKQLYESLTQTTSDWELLLKQHPQLSPIENYESIQADTKKKIPSPKTIPINAIITDIVDSPKPQALLEQKKNIKRKFSQLIHNESNNNYPPTKRVHLCDQKIKSEFLPSFAEFVSGIPLSI